MFLCADDVIVYVEKPRESITEHLYRRLSEIAGYKISKQKTLLSIHKHNNESNG